MSDKHPSDDDSAKSRLTERVVAAVEAAATAAEAAADAAVGAAADAADTRRHQAVNAPSQQSSGEFQAVLLSIVNELKTDSREHRQKLETVLVRLAEGDGRMGRIEAIGEVNRDRLTAIEGRIGAVEQTGTATRTHLKNVEDRLTSIEKGASSGIQRAIQVAVAGATEAKDPSTTERRAEKRAKSNVWVQVAAIIAGLIGTIVTCYFTFRTTQEQVHAGVPIQPAAVDKGKAP